MPAFGTSEEFLEDEAPGFDEAQATLTEFSPGASAGVSWQKKLLLLACASAIGGIVVFVIHGMGNGGDGPPAEDETSIRVPDHEAAVALTAEEDDARAKRAHATEAEPSEEPMGQEPAITVPAPAGATTASGGPASPPGPQEEPPAKRLARARQELQIRAALELEEQSLALRRAALVSQAPIRGFAEAQRRQGGGRGREQADGVDRATDEAGDGSDLIAQLAAPMRALIEARSVQGGSPSGHSPSDAEAAVRAVGIRSRGDEGQDPQHGRDKLDFFQGGGEQLKTSADVGVTKQRNPYELHMGDVIPGVLISGINSESPGEIIGQVSVDVYDSTNGNHLLIPQGSRLVGTYNATVSKGQTRVQIAWTRLRLRNGDQVDLGGMSGADQLGVSGFHDRVNRHIGRRIGAALLTTAFTVGYELTAPRSFYGSAVHRGLGESVMQTANDMAQEEAKIPPTLEIRPGYRFNIMVNQDIRFDEPYRGDGLDPAAVSGR